MTSQCLSNYFQISLLWAMCYLNYVCTALADIGNVIIACKTRIKNENYEICIWFPPVMSMFFFDHNEVISLFLSHPMCNMFSMYSCHRILINLSLLTWGYMLISKSGDPEMMTYSLAAELPSWATASEAVPLFQFGQNNCCWNGDKRLSQSLMALQWQLHEYPKFFWH